MSAPPELSDVNSSDLMFLLLAVNATTLVRFVFSISVIMIDPSYFHEFPDGYSFLRYPKSFNHWIVVWTDVIGIHFVLFCVCMFLLIFDRRPTHWIILGSAFIMFALSTADISLTFRLMTHDLATTEDYMLKRLYPKSPIFVTNKYVPLFDHVNHINLIIHSVS